MSLIVLAVTPCSAAWSQRGCAPATLRGRPAQGSPLGDSPKRREVSLVFYSKWDSPCTTAQSRDVPRPFCAGRGV